MQMQMQMQNVKCKCKVLNANANANAKCQMQIQMQNVKCQYQYRRHDCNMCADRWPIVERNPDPRRDRRDVQGPAQSSCHQTGTLRAKAPNAKCSKMLKRTNAQLRHCSNAQIPNANKRTKSNAPMHKVKCTNAQSQMHQCSNAQMQPIFDPLTNPIQSIWPYLYVLCASYVLTNPIHVAICIWCACAFRVCVDR